MFSKSAWMGAIGGVLIAGIAMVDARQAAAQPSGATVIQGRGIPSFAIFHELALVARPLSGGSDYQIESTIRYKTDMVGGASKVTCKVNGLALYEDLVMQNLWETKNGGTYDLTASSFTITGTIVKTVNGLSTTHNKAVTLPAPATIPNHQARDIASADSTTYFNESTGVLRIMESVVYLAKGGGCTEAHFYIWNHVDATWDPIDGVALDPDLDQAGITGTDHDFLASEYPEFITDFGGGQYGVKIRTLIHFEDEQVLDNVKEVPIWQTGGGGSGPGGPGGPGM